MPILPLERVRGDGIADPTIFPQNLCFSREAILFLQLARDDFRSASFLDDRILKPNSEGRWIPWRSLESLLSRPMPRRPLHFIFHSGHVGSTLLSRLLDEANGVLGLREPLPLRVLAEGFDNADQPSALASGEQVRNILQILVTLWRRGFADTDAIVIKATSSAARLGPHLLHAAPGARAVCLNLAVEPYLATLLAGENSYLDLRGQGSERHRRLARLAGVAPQPLHTMSLGEIAALTWLTETLTHRQLVAEFGDAVMNLDFDEFSRDPSQALRAVFSHYQLSAPESYFANIANSSVMTRYSKAPNQPYSNSLRQDVLAESRVRNRDEIKKGQAWLEGFARSSTAAADALNARTSA